MGFLDKAKQMAKDLDVEKAKQMAKSATDQAQAKIDEVQGNFNQSQQGGGGAPAGQGPATEYDKHGRPVPAADQVPAPPAAPAPRRRPRSGRRRPPRPLPRRLRRTHRPSRPLPTLRRRPRRPPPSRPRRSGTTGPSR